MMNIRRKLLILLLAIALPPLLLAGVMQRTLMRQVGARLAAEARASRTEDARSELQSLVDGFSRLVARDKKALELALQVQALEVERRLAADPPPAPRLFFAEDFDRGVSLPGEMVASPERSHMGPDGRLIPMPVTYGQQAYFIVRGVDRKAVGEDMARLSTMPEVYQRIYRSNPKLMYWQYTALDSGFHTSYPGHGGYPAEYDPRRRAWYREARRRDSPVWINPIVDVTTGAVPLPLSMPVHGPDGAFAGVTGIDVSPAGMFEELQPMKHGWVGARQMLVIPAPPGGQRERGLLIIAEAGDRDRSEKWQEPAEPRYLSCDDPREMAAMAADALAGRSGVRQIRHGGQDWLWAHGPGGSGEPFPVIIAPCAPIVAAAARAAQHVLGKTVQSLQITGIILAGVVVVVAVVAFVSSRSVSRPVSQLTEAARRFADGDFQAKVHIRTGDELEHLGDTFNDMGPKLDEHEKMKRSMALATEVQRHLRPKSAPKLEGFDIVGESVYCDEIGGDYYDFIRLAGPGSDKLGLAVGDVTGHGVGAALLMASARGVLRSHASRLGTDLASLFAALNSHLVRDTGEERFMTLFYGVLDAATRSLLWISGGHDPALWLRAAEGRIEELANSGIPLGVIEETTFEAGVPITLQTDDVVLIGTDGIWEARDPADEEFGKQRLLDLLTASSAESAADIYRTVVRAVKDFRRNQPQEDDITLMVIKAI